MTNTTITHDQLFADFVETYDNASATEDDPGFELYREMRHRIDAGNTVIRLKRDTAMVYVQNEPLRFDRHSRLLYDVCKRLNLAYPYTTQRETQLNNWRYAVELSRSASDRIVEIDAELATIQQQIDELERQKAELLRQRSYRQGELSIPEHCLETTR